MCVYVLEMLVEMSKYGDLGSRRCSIARRATACTSSTPSVCEEEEQENGAVINPKHDGKRGSRYRNMEI